MMRCLFKVGIPLEHKLGITSHLGMIWGTRSFPQVALLHFVFLSTWYVVFRDSLELPKGSQATCRVGLGTLGDSGTNAVYRASS